MRKITQQAVQAFENGHNFKSNNTTVHVFEDTTILKLHDNAIATNMRGVVEINLAGWNTSTTRERLNGLLSRYNMGVRSKDGQAYLVKGTERTAIPSKGWVRIN